MEMSKYVPKQYDPYSITTGPLSDSANTLNALSADAKLNVWISHFDADVATNLLYTFSKQ